MFQTAVQEKYTWDIRSILGGVAMFVVLLSVGYLLIAG